MYAKRRIFIINFLNYIQENNVGMQRNAGNGGTGHGRKFLMGFSLVAWKRESSAVTPAEMGRWPLSGHKAEPHQKFATVAGSPISCISLHSHIIFLDIVEEIYNKDLSLCIN